MWPSLGYWRPWSRDWPGHWGSIPYNWPWVSVPMPREHEIVMIEDQIEILETMLESARKRLEVLSEPKGKKKGQSG